jgi:LPXTG-motif cell wall-anchored protein
MLKAPSPLVTGAPSLVSSPFAVTRVAKTRSVLSPAAASATAASAAAFLPTTGLETTVPLSLAAGLMLTGGLGVATTSRRRRLLGRD